MTLTTEQLTAQVNQYLETNRLKEAYDCLQELLNRPEADGRTHEVAGLVAISLNRKDDAETHLLSATRQMPDDYNANYNLAILQVSQGRHDEAISRLKHLFDLQPDNAELQNDIAVIELSRSNATAAITAFETALQINPNYPQALENLSSAVLEHDLKTEAKSLFDRVRNHTAIKSETRQFMAELEQQWTPQTTTA